jgi:hypothetical protein
MMRRLGLAGASTVAALALLLGAGTAQAFTVLSEGGNATGILNLIVDGTHYDVAFEFDTADEIYGPEPGTYDFDNDQATQEAMNTVNDALDTEPSVMSVGEAFDIYYEIPYAFENDFVSVREALYVDLTNAVLGTPAWLQRTDRQLRPFQESKTYAVFTPAPEPATALLQVAALVGVAAIGRARRAGARS